MEMHQLRYLEAVARCGSMMAAAARCHVSQPALSVQIKKLEEEIGAALFLRGARGVTLTPEGARTLVTARRILREVEQLRSDARRRSFHIKPTLRIAVQPYLASELLPRLTGVDFGRSSALQLQFRENPPGRVVESVAGGAADLGLLDLSSAHTHDLAVAELGSLGYACFCHHDNALARRRTVRLAHLLDQPLLLLEGTPRLARRLQTLAREHGRTFATPFSGEMAVTLFEFVAANAGVAVLPVSFATRAGRRHVAVRPLADYDEQVVVGAVWRPDSPPPEAMQGVLDGLRRKLASFRDAS